MSVKVSILLITYNHAKHLHQCVEGIAMQKFDGELELIVADDFSSDSSVHIITTLTEEFIYPVTVLPSSQNIGFIKNYQRGFNACGGHYIAVIEGDDYWTDPLRLQKHIDFLEAHRECVMSMNRFIQLNETKAVFSVPEWEHSDPFCYINTQQMAMSNRLGNLSACVFRKNEIAKLPGDLFDLIIADWMIGMYLSQFGFIAILKDAMSVYRVHEKGMFSSMGAEERKKHLIELADIYDNYFQQKYHHEFQVFKNSLLSDGGITSPPPHSKSDYFPPLIIAIFRLLIPPYLIKRFRN